MSAVGRLVNSSAARHLGLSPMTRSTAPCSRSYAPRVIRRTAGARRGMRHKSFRTTSWLPARSSFRCWYRRLRSSAVAGAPEWNLTSTKIRASGGLGSTDTMRYWCADLTCRLARASRYSLEGLSRHRVGITRHCSAVPVGDTVPRTVRKCMSQRLGREAPGRVGAGPAARQVGVAGCPTLSRVGDGLHAGVPTRPRSPIPSGLPSPAPFAGPVNMN
jgi:hypothetical protein